MKDNEIKKVKKMLKAERRALPVGQLPCKIMRRYTDKTIRLKKLRELAELQAICDSIINPEEFLKKNVKVGLDKKIIESDEKLKKK